MRSSKNQLRYEEEDRIQTVEACTTARAAVPSQPRQLTFLLPSSREVARGGRWGTGRDAETDLRGELASSAKSLRMVGNEYLEHQMKGCEGNESNAKQPAS